MDEETKNLARFILGGLKSTSKGKWAIRTCAAVALLAIIVCIIMGALANE